MKRSIIGSSYLVITNVKKFIEELIIQVPIAVINATNLTSERHITEFNPREPIIADMADYKTMKDDETLFF